MSSYDLWMSEALAEARLALRTGDVPVAAMVMDAAGHRLGVGRNERELSHDPTAHAEVLAIRAAAEALGTWHLENTTLIVTLEPCTMCAGAISLARIRRLYYGTADPKGGGVESGVRFFSSPTCHHAPEVYSALGETQSAELLRQFFRARR